MVADNHKNLHISFDIGHSSIGWAIFEKKAKYPNPLGAGTVIFKSDDCLASKRAGFRRSRRNIASRRNRIARIKILFEAIGVIDELQQKTVDDNFPWLLAARVLQKNELLSWGQLWSVIVWYCHNRGYDGNELWAKDSKNAKGCKENKKLMEKLKTDTMAETICKTLKVNPNCHKNPLLREEYKKILGAFPRNTVKNELKEILDRHIGKLDKLSDEVVACLIDDYCQIKVPKIRLPKRYTGGLVFGQMLPRFNNRIITDCPLTGEKTPLRDCRAFYNYRWGCILANIRVPRKNEDIFKPLTADERRKLNEKMEANGYLTKTELRDHLAEICEHSVEEIFQHSNVEEMFLLKEMEKGLVLDPVKAFLSKNKTIKKIWEIIPPKYQKIFTSDLFKKKSAGIKRPCYKNWIERLKDEDSNKAKEKDEDSNKLREKLIKLGIKNDETINIPDRAKGRAPYCREKMIEAWKAVFDETVPDPKEKGGCLDETPQIKKQRIHIPISKMTNNALVRHRLLILGRLLHDIVESYAAGDYGRISRVVVEVIRDLREFSGKSNKEKKALLNEKQKGHREAVEKIKKQLGDDYKITPSLIRKTRIAMHMRFKCPYTGRDYCVGEIADPEGNLEIEHIIPRSLRPSDSLASLVLTYSHINRKKGQRTASQFIKEEQENKVGDDQEDYKIVTPDKFEKFVEGLKVKVDKKICEQRKKLLLMDDYRVQFTERDLTITSQINKLAILTIKKAFSDKKVNDPLEVISVPGEVTHLIRKHWSLMETLAKANPDILNKDDKGKQKEGDNVKHKGCIRNITHLHHAVDAITLGYAADLLPMDKNIWQALMRSKEGNALEVKKSFGIMRVDKNGIGINDIPPNEKNKITEVLAKARVVQHLPKTMAGLKVEENIRGYIGPSDKDGYLKVTQRKEDVKRDKFFRGRSDGKAKLSKINGGLIITDNYGVALDPEPRIIRYAKVWHCVQHIKKANKGTPPRILRNGNLIEIHRGRYEGIWRVCSIKDKIDGLKLNLVKHDTVEGTKKTAKENVSLNTLRENGLTILDINYCGRAKNVLSHC